MDNKILCNSIVLFRFGCPILHSGKPHLFTQLISSSWGNMHVECKIVTGDDEYVTVKGIVHDVEKNLRNESLVKKKIVDSKGERYRDIDIDYIVEEVYPGESAMCYIYGGIRPNVGTANAVVNFGGDCEEIGINATSFYNVDPVTPTGDTDAESGTGNPSGTVSAETGDKPFKPIALPKLLSNRPQFAF